MKKEELLLKVGRLEAEKTELREFDENIRREISKAFNWKAESSTSYSLLKSSNITYDPSWAEIFVKLGKLLQSQNEYRVNERIEDIQTNISEIYRKLEALTEKENV